MECRWRQSDLGKLVGRHRLFERIHMVVQLGTYLQSGRRAGIPNQLNDHDVVRRRPAAQVLRDVTEHAVRDLVPFARPRRKMPTRQPQTQVVSQFLQRHLPQPRAAAVAPTAIGGDQQFPRLRVTLPAHLPPPPRDARRRKSCRVMVDAHAHPPLVAGQIVHAVRNRLLHLRVPEVVHADLLRFTAGPPPPPRILEIAHPFLLFRVHRDRRLPSPLERQHLFVDVRELPVAVRMRLALARLAIRLQTEFLFLQFLRYRPRPDLETLLPQFRRQLRRALARPPQRLLRIASRHRLDPRRQGLGQSGLLVPRTPGPPPRSADPTPP